MNVGTYKSEAQRAYERDVERAFNVYRQVLDRNLVSPIEAKAAYQQRILDLREQHGITPHKYTEPQLPLSV